MKYPFQQYRVYYLSLREVSECAKNSKNDKQYYSNTIYHSSIIKVYLEMK